jgi:hypothetical protein
MQNAYVSSRSRKFAIIIQEFVIIIIAINATKQDVMTEENLGDCFHSFKTESWKRALKKTKKSQRPVCI